MAIYKLFLKEANRNNRIMARNKKQKNSAPFIMLYHYQYDSKAIETLTPTAFRIYMEFKRKYNGKNQDDLSLTYAELKKKFGFSSATCCKAFKELEQHGLIDTRVHGGLRSGIGTRQCNIFGLSARWIDYGKAEKIRESISPYNRGRMQEDDVA
jgi:DNA-binding MarR family transcriptional regulator